MMVVVAISAVVVQLLSVDNGIYDGLHELGSPETGALLDAMGYWEGDDVEGLTDTTVTIIMDNSKTAVPVFEGRGCCEGECEGEGEGEPGEGEQ